jgi:hypothetical protein
MRSECSASRTVATALFLLAGAISMFAQNGNQSTPAQPPPVFASLFVPI